MREYLEIEGGFPLSGEIRISGAKNAVLPALAATVLAPGRYRFLNWPRLLDLYTMLELLSRLGARVETRGEILEVDTTSLEGVEAPYELVRRMRASILVLGPLTARFGRARVALPGGCPIGKRPVDFHTRGLQLLGAEITLDHGYILARAPRGLTGTEIVFDFPSVTATENLLMAGVLARGETIIQNAAREPEVVFLGEMLQAMGGRIEGLGTDQIRIQGVPELHPPEEPLRIIPDRIETGTYLMLPGLVGGEIVLRETEPRFLKTPILRLREAGLEIESEGNTLYARPGKELRPLKIATAPYPGFPTDLQAQIIALLTQARGVSFVTETLFEDRFHHVSELWRMGADIERDKRTAIVKGPVRLQGTEVEAHDLRASASLVLAALAAEGVSRIYGLEHLDRGYERIEEKLASIGARIIRKSYEATEPF